MTYRDAMAALQQKVQALQEELETLRADASADTRAALERAFALEVAVQDAKAAAQIAHLEKEREIAAARQNMEVEAVRLRDRLHTLESELEAERKTHGMVVDALREQIAALQDELAALKARD